MRNITDLKCSSPWSFLKQQEPQSELQPVSAVQELYQDYSRIGAIQHFMTTEHLSPFFSRHDLRLQMDITAFQYIRKYKNANLVGAWAWN